MDSARCTWEVTAGIIPGDSMPEYTKRWALTSEEYYDKETGIPTEQGIQRLADLRVAALTYYTSIQNPGYVNWVRLDWVWF